MADAAGVLTAIGAMLTDCIASTLGEPCRHQKNESVHS